MKRNGSKWSRLRLAFAVACAFFAVQPWPAFAQDFMQLEVPAAEYTLGRFKYNAPRTDGWRQMANIKSSLSLVYALQPEPDKIETVFGVVMEAHDIPPETNVENALTLAATSANQMAEQRKADLVARSPVEAVPSIENLYTYRLMVRAPVAGQPDGYEIYYVMLSPDKKQYLVAQCIAKSQDYGNQLYFTEFYGSLASLRYVPEGDAAKPDAAKPKPEAESKAESAKPAEPAKAATEPAKPATEPAKPATDPAKAATDPAKAATDAAKPATADPHAH
jgi:hypothetical protein